MFGFFAALNNGRQKLKLHDVMNVLYHTTRQSNRVASPFSLFLVQASGGENTTPYRKHYDQGLDILGTMERSFRPWPKTSHAL